MVAIHHSRWPWKLQGCWRLRILQRRRATMVWPHISGTQQTHGTMPLNVGPMLQERNSLTALESKGTMSESHLQILPILSFPLQPLSLFEIVRWDKTWFRANN